MTTGILHDQNLEKHIEKQMGCMAGFFQIFDRYHILTGKRLHANKRLPPPPPVIDSTPEPESPIPDLLKASPAAELGSPAPEIVTTPAEKQTRSPLPLPTFQLKEGARSSWKLCKEAPRFSLDSRATFAGGDDMRGSPSVVARLMGLEPLPQSSLEPAKNAELRRSASESRSRDPLLYRFIDNDNFHLNQPNPSRPSNVSRNNAVLEKPTTASFVVRNAKSDPSNPRGVGGSLGVHTRESTSRGIPLRPPHPTGSPWKSSQQRKNYFAPEDSFPEPKQMAASIYGEIERRLTTRGIDEQANDLEALKHILETLHLKGLLHSQKASQHINERTFSSHQSPIVVMKPTRSPISPVKRRIATDSPPTGYRTGTGVRRSLNYGCECSPAASPRRERPENDRNGRDQVRARNSSSPTRREINAKNSNSPARGRAILSVETQRRASSPANSPKLGPKKTGSDQTITNRSPRNRKPTAKIDPKEKIGVVIPEDESSSVSESSVSTPSQADTERSKMEESKGGSSLLERCDKLLRNIGEMGATEMQPSPVSVLDSSFYKDESFSPSPVMKRRSIDFVKELPGEFEEEIWSPATSPIQSTREDKSDDSDFIYISEILRASNYLPDESDLFLLLEKQQYLIGNDTSKDTMLQRKLVFDTIAEILDAKNQLPPWKVISSPNSVTEKPSLHQIWTEFQRIRERDTAEDLFDIICGLLQKDMAGDAINWWGDSPVEMSEAALDIERLIFKDLISETIRDWSNVVSGPRMTLVF
ncbi:hypothetical protein RHSIM_Rhsim01G0271400 [Rhododendron simsii]|uniref:DUF4378 domain-containing protein n=1 Tax=Rhododendron simsii TaxID=118357 RepID=A0A834HHT4_RHOSS|nr:hypothetical protein RHSIM_Rhsim01G0271400 [Rhododendron simsii]